MNVVSAPPQAFAQTAALWIAGKLNALVEARGECSLALAGGSTPGAVYEQLALQDVPWPAIQIFFGDERRVPPDHADSNYRMARASLLDKLASAPRSVQRMQGEVEDGAEAAAAYERLLPERLDLLLLGMGLDAHSASLFPGSPAITEPSRRVVPVPGPPGAVGRLTITGREIQHAHEVAVLITGSAKASIVREVLEGPVNPSIRPVQLALHGTWLLDTDAAAELAPAV